MFGKQRQVKNEGLKNETENGMRVEVKVNVMRKIRENVIMKEGVGNEIYLRWNLPGEFEKNSFADELKLIFNC